MRANTSKRAYTTRSRPESRDCGGGGRATIMGTRHGAWMLAVACCLGAPRIAAQTTPPVEEGSRVRLSLAGPDEKRLTGTVAAVGGESLSLVAGGGRDTTAVPLRSISRLELSRG